MKRIVKLSRTWHPLGQNVFRFEALNKIVEIFGEISNILPFVGDESDGAPGEKIGPRNFCSS